MINDQIYMLRALAMTYHGWQPIESALSNAADTIEVLSKEQWIPCDERLPQTGMSDVLVTYKAMIDGGTHDGEYITSVGIGIYSNYHKQWNIKTILRIKNDGVKILAWQPLPPSYKEGKEWQRN